MEDSHYNTQVLFILILLSSFNSFSHDIDLRSLITVIKVKNSSLPSDLGMIQPSRIKRILALITTDARMLFIKFLDIYLILLTSEHWLYHLKCQSTGPGMVVTYAFNPNTQEEETVRTLWVLVCEFQFQASQARLYSKTLVERVDGWRREGRTEKTKLFLK